jgi:hypothetical protein
MPSTRGDWQEQRRPDEEIAKSPGRVDGGGRCRGHSRDHHARRLRAFGFGIGGPGYGGYYQPAIIPLAYYDPTLPAYYRLLLRATLFGRRLSRRMAAIAAAMAAAMAAVAVAGVAAAGTAAITTVEENKRLLSWAVFCGDTICQSGQRNKT